MRITLGNIDGKALGLNASEACIYAVIERCSRGDNAKGWYGTMAALAELLPFKIGRMTVTRAVEKLLTKGLIKEEGERLLANAQIEQSNAQNEHGNAQIEHENAQNELPPNNPLIINKQNEEKEKASNAGAGAPCVHEKADKQQDVKFEDFWLLAKPAATFTNRRTSCKTLWQERTRAAHRAMYQSLDNQPLDPQVNPYFWIQDFPEPVPTDYNGKSLPDKPLVIAKYNGRGGIFTKEDAELFNLEQIKDFKPCQQ